MGSFQAMSELLHLSHYLAFNDKQLHGFIYSPQIRKIVSEMKIIAS